jgi:hypothetical protein
VVVGSFKATVEALEVPPALVFGLQLPVLAIDLPFLLRALVWR